LDIKENLHEVQKRIKRAAESCGRNPDEIKLVAVSKTMPVPLLREALRGGARILGESRVQEAGAKWHEIREDLHNTKCEFHLIGHLQRNKAKDAVKIFDLIQSVDSERLALEIDRRAAEINKRQRVLIEVNSSGDESKFGISPDEAAALIDAVQRCSNLQLEGLMTIGPLFGGIPAARESFLLLKHIRDNLGGSEELPELSMGMTRDFEAAIEEGATMIRVGTAIFGSRD